MTHLITGGAGYIGSHIVRLLQEQGVEVVVVDDLSSGDPSRVGDATVVQLDVSADGAKDELAQTMRDMSVDVVVHVAAQKQVGVSMEQPTYYYRQNVGGMTNVLDAMQIAGVGRIVFSSSAATYGIPDVDLVDESESCHPINPYGETKLIGEWMLERASVAHGLSAVSLRYFNVAGAASDELGDPAALNLIPIVFELLRDGRRPIVFGADYPTPDGTCIRDYVHVLDLAQAHLRAINRTAESDSGHDIFNIGTGQGSSVFDVVREIGTVTGLDAEPDIVAPRAGDPARLIADVRRAREKLDWSSKHDLHDMVDSAWSAFQSSNSQEGSF